MTSENKESVADIGVQSMVHSILRRQGIFIRSTSDWSPLMWAVLHTYASQFPEKPNEERRQEAVKYLQGGYPNSLPCPKCRHHFKTHASGVYPHTVSRGALFAWTVNIHNQVNKWNHRPQVDLEVAAATYTRPDKLADVIRSTTDCIVQSSINKQTADACGTPGTHSGHAILGDTTSNTTAAVVIILGVLVLVAVTVVMWRRRRSAMSKYTPIAPPPSSAPTVPTVPTVPAAISSR